jgi:diguanylate cyclase (GGDEF)-like protein/PAS domain S-box-containing protein
MKRKNSKTQRSLSDNSYHPLYIEEEIGHEQLLKEYKKAVDQSTIVSITDKNGVITYVNDAFVQVSGYSKDELIGSPQSIIRHPDNSSDIFKNMWEKILNKEPWHRIIKNRAKNGSTYYVDTTITPILSSKGNIKKFIAIRHDITQIYEQEQLIHKQLKETLTGLPNRLQLLQDLEKGEHTALTIFDVDAFQEVNKLYGQMVGDELLKSVAHYLVEAFNQEEKAKKIYKLPGDVFVILCIEACHEEACKNIVSSFLQQFSENLFRIGQHEIYLNMTAGVSYGTDSDILVNANIALNNAKKLKLSYAFYNLTEEEEKYFVSTQKMIKTLKYAISNDLVIPYFQPIYNNKTLSIDKYEVLMRVIDEDGEVISPFFFLDIAHKVKIYPELTKALIRKAFEVFEDKDITFTINISIEDIRNTSTRTYIIDMISRFNRPHNVVFEIIESEEIEDYQQIKSFVTEIKKYGGRIAIDDFGSGYSNFMHLLELETNFIKIDGSIIKNILHDQNSKILTQTIVSMANKLNIDIIAEFVSSKEILGTVISLGIDYAQGHYLGEPKPGFEEFDEKGKQLSMIVSDLDIKEEYTIENKLKSLGVIVEDALNEVYIFDSDDFHFTYANKAGQRNLGYSMEELSKLTPVDIKPEHTLESFLKFYQPLKNDLVEYLLFNARYKRKDGSEYIAEIRLQKLNQNGKKQFVAIAHDITERMDLEENLKRLATIDSLTGIYNRYSINKEFDIEIERAKRYDSTFACVMLDIDHFKSVNDTYGHDIGDNILKEFTALISKYIRHGDRFGRWGGEEFILLLPELNNNQAVLLTEKLRKIIEEHLFQDHLQITVSCGVTTFNQGDSKKSLLKRADRVLYEAKNRGRNKVIFT